MTEHERQAIKDWINGMTKEEKKIARGELGIKIQPIGMIQCRVCGRRFPAKKEKKYDIETEGPFRFRIRIIKEFFDCPYCGCQNIVGERIEKINE